jgi:hypothetical protein
VAYGVNDASDANGADGDRAIHVVHAVSAVSADVRGDQCAMALRDVLCVRVSVDVIIHDVKGVVMPDAS